MRNSLIFVVASALAIAEAAGQQTATPSTSPPPLGAPKSFRLPPRHEFTLANGMKVTFVSFGTVPMVSVYCAVRTGHIDEGSNEIWLSDVTGDMLREGTTTLSAAQLAEQVAGLGGDLTVNTGSDVTRVSGAVLAEYAPEMVRIIADVVQHPALPASELERVKDNKARELAIAKSRPRSIAQEAFARILYGAHPYGRSFPTDSALRGYTLEQVRRFYSRNFGASRAHLYVVGVFDAKTVESAVRSAFAGWNAGTAPALDPPGPIKMQSVTLIDRPGAVQSTIILGLPTPGPTNTDFMSLEVTDALLGGTFGSRITTNIREQKGYSYSPFSAVATHYHDANWRERADVTTSATGASLTEIFREIRGLQSAPPGGAELDGIKNNMIGLFTLNNASRDGIVSQLEFVDEQGLNDEYLTDYVGHVQAVTPNEVQRIAQTYLQPEHMTLVVVGDKASVDSQLAPFRVSPKE